MKYTVADSTEYTYPDRETYASSASFGDVFGARGGYASFQVILSEVENEFAEVVFEGMNGAEIYNLYPVCVQENTNLSKENYRPHMPEREAPYMVYDALQPFRGRLKLTDGRAGLYIAIHLDINLKPGKYDCSLRINDTRIPVTVEVMNARVPEESLLVLMGYRQNFNDYHYAKSDAERERLDREYLETLRRIRQNALYITLGDVTEVGKNKFEFDFTKMLSDIKRYREMGFKRFGSQSIAWRKSWSASEIIVHGKYSSTSYEAYCFLSQYLSALDRVLEENDLYDCFMLGVADEPNEYNWTEYRALCGLIHRLAPKIKLYDAMSFGDLYGAIDVWIPLNVSYQNHIEEYENLRGKNGEMWFYTCCVPRADGYINRFIDYDLMSLRMLFWGSYKYNLTGYLHWAANVYMILTMPDGSPYKQNPFTETCSPHRNTDSFCYLPAGDTHIVYPGGYEGNGEIQEPWLSIRAEAQRESCEDYEMLKALSKVNKEKADEICGKVFRAFDDINHDVNKYREVRRELMEELGNVLS